MKRWMLIVWMTTAVVSFSNAQTVAEWPQVNREAKPGLRWWWLGSAVDRDNLKWNMEQYAQAGVGTLEITPIYGVKGNGAKNIAFLSTSWLDMLKYVRQQGDELGIDIDMTTGTGWPFGGPMVKTNESASKLATETHDVEGDGQKALTITLNTSGTMQKVMAFPQSGTDGVVTDLTPLVNGKKIEWTAPAGRWKVIAAFNQYGVMQVKRPSPGSEGLVVDYFDSTAVANYLKYFDDKFEAGGNPWPHSFFNDSYEITQADWTPRMFVEFEKRRGYKLEEHLDQLLANDKQVLSDYRQTLSDMLRDNFTRQWTQWAHKHGATTRNQAHGSPGNLIDLYAEADIPETENFYMNSFGIKGLRNDVGFYNQALSSRATLKYASSAAHIAGKPLVSSESMTWLTEHFRTSLSQIKPELDLLFVSGVNHVLFHGAAYSPREAAWPGWKFYASVDMSPTNSIWHDAPSMMKYIERVQSFLQMGSPDNDVLVYAPFANAMHKNSGTFQNRLLYFDINNMGSKMSELETCVKNLEAMGLDCDYVSEAFLMSTTYDGGRLLTKGGSRYAALVVPVSTYMPDSVKAHLDSLSSQGAQIVYGNTLTVLQALTVKPERLRSDMGLSVIRRSNATGHHYFIANLTPNDAEGYVPLAVDYVDAAFFDPCTGQISKAAVQDGMVWVSLKSGQSVLLQTYDSGIVLPTVSQPVCEQASIDINTPWTLTFADDAEPSMAGKTYVLDKLQTWETLDAATARLMGTGIYETVFNLTATQLATATAGFRLNLGDVRESARVWLNGEYLGCAWSVPYVLDCRDLLREGSNTLKIEVTNLPANRIRQMDVDGTEWRIFEDINMSNISTASYAGWALVPSGLNTKVSLIPLAARSEAVDVQLQSMKEEDGRYYPQYGLKAMNGSTLTIKNVTDQQGQTFSGYVVDQVSDGSLLLTVTGFAGGDVVAWVEQNGGAPVAAYVPAMGAYSRCQAIDFTADVAPDGGWDVFTSISAINGFDSTVKLPWRRAKLTGKTVTGLYEGLTFSGDKSVLFFYYPGYGMNMSNDCLLTVDEPAVGEICKVACLVGEGQTVYDAADSLLQWACCTDLYSGLTMPLRSRSNYYIYRSLERYTPVVDVTPVEATVWRRQMAPRYYNLHGQPVVAPLHKGIYVSEGKKVVIR